MGFGNYKKQVKATREEKERENIICNLILLAICILFAVYVALRLL